MPGPASATPATSLGTMTGGEADTTRLMRRNNFLHVSNHSKRCPVWFCPVPTVAPPLLGAFCWANSGGPATYHNSAGCARGFKGMKANRSEGGLGREALTATSQSRLALEMLWNYGGRYNQLCQRPLGPSIPAGIAAAARRPHMPVVDTIDSFEFPSPLIRCHTSDRRPTYAANRRTYGRIEGDTCRKDLWYEPLYY
jgi:hypothetical protein